jgi:glycosyltransferase involved in cell wall biosynthesis
MSERKKVLWLASWYPNKYDPFDGDFIQRHARAAALYDDVHVIFVKESEKQIGIEQELNVGEGLTEQIIYLSKRNGLPGKLQNYFNWQRSFKEAVGILLEKHQPDLIHVHIPWKAGLMALWIKKKYKIPFLITEHWGIYNHVVDDNIHTKSFLARYLLKRIYKGAKTFISVSQFLGDGVNRTLVRKRFTVIPNVVDTSLFFPSNKKKSRFTFLHVSNMVPLKNVEGIINAFYQFVEETNADAQLIFVGNRDDHYPQIAKDLGLLNRSVFFKGEVPYTEVARQMQRSHAFVLNSNIENSPSVIGEALCCGLPVLTTKVGGIPELVSKENSLFVDVQNNTNLCKAMIQIFHQYHEFNASDIASAAKQKFSLAAVGRQLHQLY